jgi:hypothetical protein
MYYLFRGLHLLVFLAMAALAGRLYGTSAHDSMYPLLALTGGFTCFIELAYLGSNRWRVNLTYFLLLTAYVALALGTTIMAFKLAR